MEEIKPQPKVLKVLIGWGSLMHRRVGEEMDHLEQKGTFLPRGQCPLERGVGLLSRAKQKNEKLGQVRVGGLLLAWRLLPLRGSMQLRTEQQDNMRATRAAGACQGLGLSALGQTILSVPPFCLAWGKTRG